LPATESLKYQKDAGLVRMRPDADRVHLIFALGLDPGMDHIGDEDIPFANPWSTS
jgi:hypothetical protein